MRLLIMFALVSLSASAGDVYKCGNEYTDKPCGPKLNLHVQYPSCDDRVAAIERYYKEVLSNQENFYRRREFELVNSMLRAPNVIQITNVRAQSGSYSGASVDLRSPSP